MATCCGMGKKSPRLQAMQARQDPNAYPKEWAATCCCACCESPLFGCYVMLCPCCASFGLRKRALHGDMSRYKCCNGAMSCCSCCCCEESCPNCCLCLEVFCCFSMSVWTTRYMIQDEMRLQTDCCDGCIIGCLVALECLACICSCIACITGNEEAGDCSSLCHCIAEIIWCTACTCFQVQHHIELDVRDKEGAPPRGGPPPMQAPQQQQIAMGGQPVYAAGPPPPGNYHPAPGGYPPAPGGYPPAPGYAPPNAYPAPPGYAPQGPYAPPPQQGAPSAYPQVPSFGDQHLGVPQGPGRST